MLLLLRRRVLMRAGRRTAVVVLMLLRVLAGVLPRVRAVLRRRILRAWLLPDRVRLLLLPRTALRRRRATHDEALMHLRMSQ